MKIDNFLLKTLPFGAWLLWIAVVAMFGSERASGQKSKKVKSTAPNVILIMCDDLGWGDVKFNNPKTSIRTPQLDEMAKNSLRMTRFYAAAPVCSPTRGSCLTGRHPYRYGIVSANRGHLPKQEWTITKLLKARGYRTGHFGKWHLGTLSRTIRDSNRGGPKNEQHFAPPWNRDFDVCFSTEAKVPTFDPMFQPRGANQRGWDALKQDQEKEPYGTRYWDQTGKVVTRNLDGDDSRLIMDRAINFIGDSAEKNQPFFAVVWFHAPHLPVVADPVFRDWYRGENEYRRNYFGCISSLDAQVGRLRSLLRKQKVAENTVLFFCSDNGPEGKRTAPGQTAGLRGRKRSLYEGGVRVPALVEWPSTIKSGSTDYPAVTSDYLPTVMAILNAKMPDHRPLDGVSLLPLFKGEQQPPRKGIGFASRKQHSWVGMRYKLYKNGDRPWQLFDLVKDFQEQHDLASSQPQRVSNMSAEFLEWQKSCQQSAKGDDYR